MGRKTLAGIRRGAALLGLSLLTTCRVTGPHRPLVENDRDRLIQLMGGIDAHLMEIQRGAADPIEPARLSEHLAGMRRNFQKAAALDLPHAGFPARARDAAGTVASMERAPWTPANRDARYSDLRALCSACHADFAPPLSRAVADPPSAAACGRCHERVYEEWKGTLHARAWVDPVYRMSAGNPPKLECRVCHSMEPILAREISTDVTYRPVFRPYLHEEGVNCLSCHGLADGSVAAARDVPGAPCRPRRDDRLRTPEFCGACHNPSHLAYDEWKLSRSGKSCTDCHALRDGKFSHRMLGVHDADFVRRAVAWTCEVKDGEVVITLVNRSGHRLPAEVPTRVLRLVIRIDEAEEELVYRRPNKNIVGDKDNRLWPDETRVVRRRVTGARKVEVEILYQQSPFVMPRGWIVVGKWERAL